MTDDHDEIGDHVNEQHDIEQHDIEQHDIEQHEVEQPAADPGDLPGRATVRYDLVGTALFALALAVTIPLRHERVGQVTIIAVSMVLFAAGAATSLWAYAAALERSRSDNVGVANLYLLSGETAPVPIRRLMWGCLAAQSVLALVGAIVGVVGLGEGQLNALAFGVLVPMFGIGANGVWAARHGTYGPRLVPRKERPNNRKIG